jgi:NDP-sugar pyrophosphorylase family protein
MSPVTALVLMGGKGTRLAGLYPDLPKPLVPVAGEPFAHWLVMWLKRQGLRDFVFSLGYRGDQIESWLKDAPVMADVNWRVLREPESLGTGGGVRACLHLCQNDLLIANGDSLMLAPLNPAMALLKNQTCDGVLLGVLMQDASRYGTLAVDREGRLTGFCEKRPGAGLINSGIYLFRKFLLEEFPTNQNLSMEYDVIPKLIAGHRRLFVHQAEANVPFIDIGTPESLAQADTFVGRFLHQAG